MDTLARKQWVNVHTDSYAHNEKASVTEIIHKAYAKRKDACRGRYSNNRSFAIKQEDAEALLILLQVKPVL